MIAPCLLPGPWPPCDRAAESCSQVVWFDASPHLLPEIVSDTLPWNITADGATFDFQLGVQR